MYFDYSLKGFHCLTSFKDITYSKMINEYHFDIFTIIAFVFGSLSLNILFKIIYSTSLKYFTLQPNNIHQFIFNWFLRFNGYLRTLKMMYSQN